MSYRPRRDQLRGLPYEVAERYGKPHIDAFYAGGDVRSHRRRDDAICAVCHRPATSVHHDPPLSKGRSFLLRTRLGTHVLRPALFALCGDGTTGCHNDFHGGARYRATWVWYSDECAEMWWEGVLLKRMAPHSRELYRYGYWSIHDAKTGHDIEVRQ